MPDTPEGQKPFMNPDLETKFKKTLTANQTAAARIKRATVGYEPLDEPTKGITNEMVEASADATRGVNDLQWFLAAMKADIPQATIVKLWELKDELASETKDRSTGIQNKA